LFFVFWVRRRSERAFAVFGLLFCFLCLGAGVGIRHSFILGGETSHVFNDGRGKETSDAGGIAINFLCARFEALLDGDPSSIEKNYLLSSTEGQWAWEREKKRVNYLSEWQRLRGVQIVEARATFEIDSVDKEKEDLVWIELTEHAIYAYEYPEKDGIESPIHRFGSRAIHVLEMVKVGGDWKIRKDWYTDPLGNEAWNAPCLSPEEAADAGPLTEAAAQSRGGSYERDKAKEYAVKHSGVRSLPEGGRYNPKYRIYTFLGGDCANFASQVLHAGGVPQGGGWHYTNEGSTSWVQSESLIWHLLSSGKGQRLLRGTYQDAVKPREGFPTGVISALEPGDIIAYEAGGRIVHVAVVTGKDPKGYVTIASHTADRLHFPWDLGWDKGTVFWLVKIVW